MKFPLFFLFTLSCLALFGQTPRVKVIKPQTRVVRPQLNPNVKPDIRVARDLRPNLAPRPINGVLTLRPNQVYTVPTDVLNLDTLVMMSKSQIILSQQHTTIIVGHAIISSDCSILGVGETGEPGRDGRDGGTYRAKTSIGVRVAFNGEKGKTGEEGGPAKELDIYLESVRYKAPLNIILQGGKGGDGGKGGNGAPKTASCSKLTVGTNGGNGGIGGPPGGGGSPRIMLGKRASNRSVVSTARIGVFGRPGLGGEAGRIKKVSCIGTKPKVKQGIPGMAPMFTAVVNETKSTGQGVTPYFPYPPPKPSAMVAELPVEIPVDSTLGTVEDMLRAALKSGGYEDLRYYKVPEGYAIVTGMERFTEEGVPLKKERWSAEADFVGEFSLASYLKSLFTARKGYFRLIVFMVTADDLLTSNEPISRAEAMDWFKSGWSRLPKELADGPFTAEHYVSALVYEFSITENVDGPVFSEPSSLSAEAHLRGAALWERLISDQ